MGRGTEKVWGNSGQIFPNEMQTTDPQVQEAQWNLSIKSWRV